MAQNYDQTLNLPKTEFPMRAGLPQAEPKMLADWGENRLYDKLMEQTKDAPVYVFHDGPPYANAAIHLGTALNKVLKDFIVRHKNMSGHHLDYIPGWDTHGLPIELKAIEEYGVDIVKDPIVLRQHCHDFALEHVETQKAQFKRLGTLADYDHPYLTLAKDYEAQQIKVFGSMAENKYIYKDLRPGYWCAECVTALAEAEIEYADDVVNSIYVKMPIVEDPNGVIQKMGGEGLENTYVIIWTTTTWTLPANQAISVNPNFEYVLVKTQGEFLLLAKERVEETMKTAENTEYEVLGTVLGEELEFIQYQHPFLDRVSPIILGEHVTLEAGTGAVHTAPGHGEDDYNVVTSPAYKELFSGGILVPVDEEGRMTKEAGDHLEGLSIYKANKVIEADLVEHGLLFSSQRLTHQYPHCWRCKKPILFRATEQWFISLDDFKAQTEKSIDAVKFIPEWGQDRMHSMVGDRSSWTISRQRAWGVPIPIFYCDDCGNYVVTKETTDFVSDMFAKEGSDSWFIRPAEELLPEGFTCPHCKTGKTFTKEMDTMDVWFDSGCSHASVLDQRQHTPADLYLEGGDQYRGWFQSSLLTSVAWKGRAPYKTVCTHGMVVDEQGRKMSKSLGNGMDPHEIYDKFGADILRLWVASSDYHNDIRISNKIIGQLAEAYRKIRNTTRFMLANISDFDPKKDKVAPEELLELDRWALATFQNLLARSEASYDAFEFHNVYHGILNFCTTDMSNFYLDIIKDRLYIEKPDGLLRRSAQTAMYEILSGLILLVAPILPFTSEELWQYLPHEDHHQTEYAVLNQIPNANLQEEDSFMERWQQLSDVRDTVNKALEEARDEKIIGKSLEAKVTITAGGSLLELLQGEENLLKTICIVSQVELLSGEDTQEVKVVVTPAEGDKCERCWVIDTSVGRDETHPTLCARCVGVLES